MFRLQRFFFIALLTGVGLAATTAQASRVLYPGATPKMIKTSMGTFPHSTVEAFCKSPNIVVGEIASVQSFIHTVGIQKSVMSHATFDVAQVLRNETSAQLHLVLSGGRVGTQVQAPSSGLMVPIKGIRYLLAYTSASTAMGYVKKGDPLVAAHLFINTDEDLDPDAVSSVFQQFMEDHCE